MNKLSDGYTTITLDEFLDWIYDAYRGDYGLARLHQILTGEYDLDKARKDLLSFRKEQ